MASIDAHGILRLVGRSNELIIINGIKYLPHELEDAIERADIAGVARSFVICFANRPKDASTDHIYVVYQREYDEENTEARMDVIQVTIRTVMLVAGARPRILPLAPGRPERTTLGKISPAKTRSSLLRGEYQDQIDIDTRMLQAYREGHLVETRNCTERALMEVSATLNLARSRWALTQPFLRQV